jgi:hypothetical protein
MKQTSWTLAAEVHAVDHDGDLVLLDVAADSYLCLPAARGRVSLRPPARGLRIADPAIAAALRTAGLAAPWPRRSAADSAPAGVEVGGAAPDRPPPPRQTAVKLAYPRPGWRDVATGLGGLFELLRDYRRRPFAEVLRRGVAGRPPVADAPSRELLAAVDGFHRWIPYAPVRPKCLVRSFLLLRWLVRHGHGAYWVFGVTTWPFRAHCWLQCGAVALDDDVERLAAYSVIMVL